MPRKARIDIRGLLQHVIVRGIEKRDIFIDDEDRRIFVERLLLLLEETDTDCFAWSLLDNHFHLLLRCNMIDLSRFMSRLLTGYAINFNRRHRRSGHLFQNRYKSIVCEESTYLLELIRYIHLNPLRAGKVSDIESLEVYSWCGHGVLMGQMKFAGQVVNEVLSLFGKKLSVALTNYRQFVTDGVPLGIRPELVGGGLRRSQKAVGIQAEIESYDDRVLGSGSFVEALQQDANLQAISPAKLTLVEIHKVICRLFDVEPESIFKRTRMNSISEARTMFCYVAVSMIGVKGTIVGEFIGMGSSGVCKAVRRGELIMKERKGLKERLQQSLLVQG